MTALAVHRIPVPANKGGLRILLAPTGTLGDVYPFIAVGLALRERGCTPVVAAMEHYRADVEAAGLTFRPIRPGRAELNADGLDEPSIARAVARDQRAAFGFTASHLDATLADLTAAASDCDLVVGGPMSVVARMVAEVAGLPIVTLMLQPMGFLSCTDPPVLREAPWLAVVGRRCGPAAAAALYRVGNLRARAVLRPLARLRARLGLPLLRDELRDGPRRGDGSIALYSTAFAPLPDDAPAGAVSAGFPFYNGTAAALAPDLARFLDAGPPPLVFTLGSFVVHAAGDFYSVAAALAQRLGRRAVLLVGHDAVRHHARLATADVFVTGHAPHDRLFPRAAAAIHHGGIGTVAQACRAGLPQLVCPFFGDQFDNAAHLERLGVSATLALARFTVKRAQALIVPLLAEPGIIDRAASLARRMSGEDGPMTAAEAIEALALKSRRRGSADIDGSIALQGRQAIH